jgi:tetratricopeptide (TPR) repeat protein
MTTEQKGFIAELFTRRVPQIMGVYIGACWLTVEMGEWAAEQLGLAPGLVAYVFVLMIALLPSVAVLAWNHGAPGRDRSPKFEKFFVPANLVAALVGVVAFFGYAPPGAPGSAIAPVESAVVERTVVDEAGEERTFTVAREGYHRFVLASFWQQANTGNETNSETETDPDAAPDWRQYAVPWLLGVALNRDPLLSVRTAYELNIANELRDAGFPDAVGEPRALAIRLAERAGLRYLLRGELSAGADGLVLTARVIDARSGEVTGEARAEGAGLIEATERLADQLRPLLTPEGAPEDRFTTLPLAEAASSSEAAIEALIEGLNRLQLRRDFEGAVEAAERAREIDPTFALVHVWLNQLYRFVGDLPAASAAAEQALTLEYKLDSEVVFAMKANRFAQSGDYPTAMRVLRMWTEVHPESFQAWITLAQNMIAMGDVEEARRALREAERVDPSATRLQRMFATVESLSGDYEEAARRLRAYIAEEPRDADARLELGRALIRAGQPEAAMDAYREAELVADDSRRPRLAQAALHVRQGRLEAADRILDPMLAAGGPPDRSVPVLMVRFDRLSAAGRDRDLLALVAAEEEALKSGLGPQGYWLRYAEWVSEANRTLGELDAAADAVTRAEEALGDPIGRFLALHRMELLMAEGAPIEALEAQVERLAFFETQFSVSGAVAMVGWARAKLASARGESAAAVAAMREARELFRESGSSLDADSMEAFDLELARLLRADGQDAEARRLLDDLLVQHPALGKARLERAALSADSGDADAARDDLERLFEQWSEASDGYAPLARARSLFDGLD